MRVPDPPLPLDRIADFAKRGYWLSITSNDMLERWAAKSPGKVAIVDGRVRLTYADYHARARRLAAYFLSLGLTNDDVIAVQLPNWSEFPVTISGAMLAGIPFCQFHSDFRSREIEFILRFTEASVLILPREFRGFDYLAMLAELRPKLPKLRHVLVVGDTVPEEYVDLRSLLEAPDAIATDEAALRARRPHPNAFCRTAFTSGTTGDPKAVLHLHNTTNAAIVFLNELHRIGVKSVLMAFLPVGLNWDSSTCYRRCSPVARSSCRTSSRRTRRSASLKPRRSRISARRRPISYRCSTRRAWSGTILPRSRS